MSISSQYAGLVASGRLHELRQYISGPIERPVYLAPLVATYIFGPPWPSQSPHAAKMAEVRALLEAFMYGGRVTATFDKKPKQVMLRRLQPPKHELPEIWELRVLQPPPGVRLFGAFAETDVLIITGIANRIEADFASEISAAKADWKSLFPNHSPLVSKDHHVYISARITVF